MQTSYIITFIGDDRPGLVGQLAAVIQSSGGNWTQSRLAQLGGKFTGLILVSLASERREALESALRDLAQEGISVRVTEAGSRDPSDGVRPISLNVIGPDRPGIVKEVSSALAQRQINVVEMDSKVESAPMSSEAIFSAHIDAHLPESTSLDTLHDALEQIANSMTLDIDLV